MHTYLYTPTHTYIYTYTHTHINQQNRSHLLNLIFDDNDVITIKSLMISLSSRYFVFIKLNWEILERVKLDITTHANKIQDSK